MLMKNCMGRWLSWAGQCPVGLGAERRDGGDMAVAGAGGGAGVGRAVILLGHSEHRQHGASSPKDIGSGVRN